MEEVRTVTVEDVDMGRLSAFLNMTMTLDTFTPKQLSHGILDDVDYDPTYNLVALDREHIVGFMAGAMRRRINENTSQGLIKLFAVHRNYRRRGIAGSMLGTLEAMFKEAGATEVTIGYDGALFFHGGCDPRYTEAYLFLRRNGFEETKEEFYLSVDLRDELPDTTAIEKHLADMGIRVARPRMAEKQEVMEWIAKELGGGWDKETAFAFRENDITVWAAREARGGVCGFAVSDAVFYGCFGPIGVQESLRGNRIGALLVVRCMEDMRRHGHTVAWIPAGKARVAFYHRCCNARIERFFWKMKKTLV